MDLRTNCDFCSLAIQVRDFDSSLAMRSFNPVGATTGTPARLGAKRQSFFTVASETSSGELLAAVCDRLDSSSNDTFF